MSDVQKCAAAAAAEIVDVLEDWSPEAAQKTALRILEGLYIEVCFVSGHKLSKEAEQAMLNGDVQWNSLSNSSIIQQFLLIEIFIKQSEGKTREAKIDSLFKDKKIYKGASASKDEKIHGVSAKTLYAEILSIFPQALVEEAECRLNHSRDNAKLLLYLQASRPSKLVRQHMRRWIKQKRREL